MNNNNSKRKNRPSGVSRYTTDNRQPKNRPVAQGVYNNTHFMHAATALVGNVVQMRLRSGNIYEGVFRTFSPVFDVALELPSCIKFSKNAPEECKLVPNFMIFPYDTVVSISAKDFDSQYATKGSAFQTDAAISEKCNGIRFEEKELEPWDPSGMNGDIDIELDGASNGWDANEMFRKNENQFGVQSTFDDSLSTYTVQLDKKDSDEFKEQQAKAEKLAAEIENNPAYRERLDLENGDEEAVFAAVERPSLEVERERERERERDMEREREREREREDRSERERGGYEQQQPTQQQQQQPQPQPQRVVMTERYITKPTRSITGPPPPVAMASNAQQATTAAPIGGGPSSRGGGHDRDAITERPERIMNAPPPTAMGQANSTQSSAAAMAGGMKGSAPPSSNAGNMGGQDSGSKYGGGSLMKRKPVSQGGKLVRNTPPPNNGGNSGAGGNNPATGGNSGNMSQIGGNNAGAGGGKGTGYQNVPPQPGSYQHYANILHANSSYRGMGDGMSKINGEANSGKQLIFRNSRQYQGGQSNSNMNYGEQQNQMPMGKSQGQQQQQQQQHGRSANNSTSPPLQSGGGGGGSHGHVQAQNNVQNVNMSGPPPNQQAPPPQPQRQLRNRDNQMQDLRQFGQDFQLGGNNTSPPQQQQQQPQAPPQQQQQQQQQQHMILSGKPQPSVSPPQHMAQQHVPMQHVPQQHVHGGAHHGVPPPQHTHAPPPQVHYAPPPQVVQQQQHAPMPHMQQKPPPQHVDASNMMHVTKGPPPSHHGVSVPLQQQQQQQAPLPQEQQPQPMYHHVSVPPPPTQQQTSPVVISSPPIDNSQHAPIQQQQQPLQQQQQVNKSDATPTVPSMSQQPPPHSVVVTAISDKATPPNSNASNSAAVTNSGGGVGGGVTAVVKKTHVLNPSAKPFTPRSPSTPNPSRPHTPQTPVPMQGIFTTGAHVPNNQGPIYVVQQQPPAAFQAPTHPQQGQQPRMRRSNYGPMASQMHVSATTATGQPLMAAAPLQQIIQYHQAPHAQHFPSQPYTQMMRMYHEQQPQQLQFLAQTPPSTTPSPGQPHQAFHPQPQPSPAGGGPQPTFAPQTQQAYHVMCPLIHPSQLMANPYYQAPPQHQQQSQQFQIVMQQHPTQ